MQRKGKSQVQVQVEVEVEVEVQVQVQVEVQANVADISKCILTLCSSLTVAVDFEKAMMHVDEVHV